VTTIDPGDIGLLDFRRSQRGKNDNRNDVRENGFPAKQQTQPRGNAEPVQNLSDRGWINRDDSRTQCQPLQDREAQEPGCREANHQHGYQGNKHHQKSYRDGQAQEKCDWQIAALREHQKR
jgi:hypothetical protein